MTKYIIIPKPFDPLLQFELNNANVANANLLANNELLQSSNNQLLADIGTLQSNNNSLTNDIASLNSQIASLTNDNNNLTNANSSLTNSNNSLATQLTNANNTIASLNSQIVAKNNQITSLTNSNNSLTSQVNSLNSQVTSLNNQIATLNSQVVSLNSQIATLTATNNSLTTQLNQQNTVLTMQWTGTWLQANGFVMTLSQNGTSVIATDNKGGTYTGTVSNYNNVINGQWVGTISGMFNNEAYPTTGQTFNHKAGFDGNNALNKYNGHTTTFKGTFAQSGTRQ